MISPLFLHRLVVAMLLTLAATLLGCAQTSSVTSPPSPSAADLQQAPADAKTILVQMAEALVTTPEFSVTLTNQFDVLQSSGQKIEFGETRKILIRRPDGLRVELEESNGNKHSFFYDGQTITVYSPDDQVYAQADVPGDIDAAIKYFIRDLQMRLPLALLLHTGLVTAIEKRTESLDYVETTLIQGQKTHHLAGRTKTVDYQVWVSEGAKPLPLRVVLTYKNADGQPEFRAQFSDWNFNPDIESSHFVFTPPAEAQKIAFLAQFANMMPGSSEQAVQTGEQP